ncbi:hypothetical protein D3C87_1721830 [compost metagenome]
MPSVSALTTKGPEPMIFVASPSCSKGSARVESETMPEPITDVPCRKPGEGFLKVNFTVSGSMTSLRS